MQQKPYDGEERRKSQQEYEGDDRRNQQDSGMEEPMEQQGQQQKDQDQ